MLRLLGKPGSLVQQNSEFRTIFTQEVDSMAEHNALMHEAEDHVAVAIADLKAGTEVRMVTLEGQEVGTLTLVEDIPLGHKFATRDVAAGAEVVEYGRSIGKAMQAIAKGGHTHTHNIKSVRWA
jgi:(2R)-sulfolactate sulfo-lyase subunit alpha